MALSNPSKTDTISIPAAADLDTWSDRDWSDGVQVDDLPPLDRLLVRTRNTFYEVTVLEPHTGDVIVHGGRFFPQPTRARLSGSSLGGSFLKLRGIYVGFSVEFWCDGETVITSPVRSVSAAPLDQAKH